MKTKSFIKLAVFFVILAGVIYWSLFGFTVHITRFKPWYELVRLGMDLKGGVTVVYQAKPSEKVELQTGIKEVIEVIQKRLNDKGYTEASVQQQGLDRVRVEIPELTSPDQVLDLIGTAGKLEFKDESGKVLVTGENISQANYAGGPKDGKYLVNIVFDSEGADLFRKATTDNKGKTISIYLDGTLVSSPTVNDIIPDGKGIISSSSQAQSQKIALVLASGSMPLQLTELSANTVSATLGAEALQKAFMAGIAGIGMVLLFMLVMYRIPGLAANLGLVVYMIIMYWFSGNFPWNQLTLPSIAGILLSVGMAVDMNVVIFERMKDEYRVGKSRETSIEEGFQKALSAIIDTNVTSVIAAVVLLLPFSPAPLKNFAMSFIAGIVISMFTSLFVCKRILNLLVKIGLDKPFLLGLKRGEKE